MSVRKEKINVETNNFSQIQTLITKLVAVDRSGSTLHLLSKRLGARSPTLTNEKNSSASEARDL